MRLRIKVLVISSVLMLLVIIVLPFYTVENYSILRNTTSQLGAQQTPNAWIMNMVFILLGSSSILAGWSHYKGYWFHRVLLLGFGGSLILTAFFHHAPIDVELVYNVRHDQLHSYFASSTGLCFTLLAISTGFMKNERAAMLLPIGIGVMASVLSLLMFTVDDYMGIWQRLIFISSFGWMVYEFRNG